MFLQQSKSRRADTRRIMTEIGKVVADEGKLRLLWINTLQSADSLYRPHLMNVAAESINGIGRIDDDATALQTVYDLADQPRLRVLGMYAKNHGYAEF